MYVYKITKKETEKIKPKKMEWTITFKNAIGRLKGTEFNKTKYIVKNDTQEYVVLHWPGAPCIVYDKINESLISNYSWWYSKINGYVYAHDENGGTISMHSIIMKQSKDLSIDHINYIKTFNILDNLRYASQSEQNSNRPTRKDKLPPPKELIDIGIIDLPRHVRYDTGEKKFVIEKNHPGIAKITGTFNYSGTKSTTVSMIYKYYDILKKLDYLNTLIMSQERILFLEKQKQLFKDYSDIAFLITGEKVDDINYLENCDYKSLEQYLTDTERSYERGNLPETIPKLPPYCCYVKEKGNRGDNFYVSKHHPNLKAIGRGDIKTTGSKGVTTMEKYNKVLVLLDTINSFKGDELTEKLK